MKKNIIIFFVMLSCIVTSCENSEIKMYEEAPGVYFLTLGEGYSFTEHLDKIDVGYDTLRIPVQITGTAVYRDRIVRMELNKDDTLNTAEPQMYEILEGEVKAGEYRGFINIKINYSKVLNDSVYVVRVKMIETEDFPIVDLQGSPISVNITNKFSEPVNWYRITREFGTYSDSWYKFILQTTGLTYIPYWSYRGKDDSANPDPERWYITYYELGAYAAYVKDALTKYNNDHPNDNLIHSNGDNEGEKVVMP